MTRRLLLLLALLLVAAVGWVGVRGWLARGHLEAAADRLPTLQRQVAELDVDATRTTLARLREDTAAAADLTDDPVWDVAAAFPWGGQNLEAVAGASAAVEAFARDVGPGLLDAVAAAERFTGRLDDGDLDPAALRDAADGVEQLETALESARTDVAGIDRSYLVGPVEESLGELERGLDLAGDAGAGIASELAP